MSTPSGDLEAQRRLEAFLRRPGEVFTDEWQGYAVRHDSPPISTSWLFAAPDERVNVHLEWEDDWGQAWDVMRDDRDFSDWYLTHELALQKHGNEVVFEERPARLMRVSTTGALVLRLPVTEMWEAADEVVAFQEVIWQVLARRARRESLTAPPQIT